MTSFLRVTLSFFFLLTTAQASVEELCQEVGGTIQKGYKCPDTSFPLLSKVCFFKNDYGDTHFTDGCTGPSGGHRDLFSKACLKHDLCYHHEPATSGKTQKQCDREFLENMLAACVDAKSYRRCERWAKVMYRTLRVFGGLAYRCDNTPVTDYIQYH